MTYKEYLNDAILRFARDNQDMPGQITAHPEFYRGLIKELGTRISSNVYFGIPVYVSDKVHSISLATKAAMRY